MGVASRFGWSQADLPFLGLSVLSISEMAPEVPLGLLGYEADTREKVPLSLQPLGRSKSFSTGPCVHTHWALQGSQEQDQACSSGTPSPAGRGRCCKTTHLVCRESWGGGAGGEPLLRAPRWSSAEQGLVVYSRQTLEVRTAPGRLGRICPARASPCLCK